MTAATEASRQVHPILFEPIRIGRVEVRNRVFSSAHGTGMATAGVINDRHIAYHLERARGGIGLIVLEATSVDGSPMGMSMGRTSLRNSDETVIEPYRALADALHREGTKVFCLLSHAGANTVMGPTGAPPLAPSPIPMDRTRDIPHVLETWEIRQIVEDFAAAAERCKRGGLDGVELSYTHGNLVQSFLSPLSNKRTDEYGGSEANRLRLAKEVLQAVRGAVGDDFTLGIRFSADELVPGGYTVADGVRWAPLLVQWGPLDFIDVSAGTNSSMWSRSRHYPTISMPYQPLVELSKAIKRAVDVPVFCVGKIVDPVEASKLVVEGYADMVAMTRAHIAEPEIVNKALAGRLDEIRSCIYCNESCFGRQDKYGDISCVYNPRSGRELLWPAIRTVSEPRRVLVVGGGPAGLEAARVAAKSGHRVTLIEAEDALGGQLRSIPLAPTREVYGQILEWYLREIARHGVDVRLNERFSADDVRAFAADHVIVATGAKDALPDILLEGSTVVSVREALAGAELGHRVVVGDWDGGHRGMSVAEFLVRRGHTVELISPTFYVGMDVDRLTWHPFYERLQNAGVVMAALEEITAIRNGVAEVTALNGAVRRVRADAFVLCTKGEADGALYRSLHGTIADLHVAGDCWSPRHLEQAIFEGAKAARSIDAPLP